MSLSAQPQSFAEHYQTSAYSEFDQEHRSGGTFGLTILDVKQEAIEITDPGVPEYAFPRMVGNGEPGEFDFGDGWTRSQLRDGVVDIQPANQDCHFRIPDAHMRIPVAPAMAVERLLDEVGATPASLEGTMGQFLHVPRAAIIIDSMWLACQHQSPATNLFIDGAFLELIAVMMAAAGHGHLIGPVAAIGDHRLARAIEYMETNIAAPLTVGALSAVACMSPSHFARAFKAATDESVWSYVVRRRLERAHEMRLMTQASLAEIAFACGFADAAHLSRSYRARYGKSISER